MCSILATPLRAVQAPARAHCAVVRGKKTCRTQTSQSIPVDFSSSKVGTQPKIPNLAALTTHTFGTVTMGQAPGRPQGNPDDKKAPKKKKFNPKPASRVGRKKKRKGASQATKLPKGASYFVCWCCGSDLGTHPAMLRLCLVCVSGSLSDCKMQAAHDEVDTNQGLFAPRVRVHQEPEDLAAE